MLRFNIYVICILFFSGTGSPAISADNDSLPQSAKLLSRYIMHKSVTGNERPAGLFLSTVARQKGLYVEVLTDEPGSFNFTASLYPLENQKPNIVLLNHIDVVPATEEVKHKYIYPPFAGTIADGKVWGRGAIDNKSMGVMQLLAMEKFIDLTARVDLPFNITMLSVSGEETGGHKGAKIISDKFMEYLNPVAVYGEGGSGIPDILIRDTQRKLFGVSVAFKRSLWLELTLRSVSSGHGAVPPAKYVIKDKIISINRLVQRNTKIKFSGTTRRMFYELGQMEGGLRGLALKNIWLFRPFVVPAMKRQEIVHSLITNTITVTSINTPNGPPNQIPQEISVILDCRLLPGTPTEEFTENIRKVLGNDDVEIRILQERKRTSPTEIDEYYYYMKEALEKVYPGAGVLPILAPASNDNNYFRQHGIPTYGILPVFLTVELLETIHNVNERMPIVELEHGVAAYRELIRNIIESKYDIFADY